MKRKLSPAVQEDYKSGENCHPNQRDGTPPPSLKRPKTSHPHPPKDKTPDHVLVASETAVENMKRKLSPAVQEDYKSGENCHPNQRDGTPPPSLKRLKTSHHFGDVPPKKTPHPATAEVKDRTTTAASVERDDAKGDALEEEGVLASSTAKPAGLNGGDAHTEGVDDSFKIVTFNDLRRFLSADNIQVCRTCEDRGMDGGLEGDSSPPPLESPEVTASMAVSLHACPRSDSPRFVPRGEEIFTEDPSKYYHLHHHDCDCPVLEFYFNGDDILCFWCPDCLPTGSQPSSKAILLRLWKCEGDANTRIFEGFASSKVNPTTGQVTINTNCGYGHHVLNLKLLKVVKSNAFSVQVMGVDGSDTGPASYVFQFLPTDRNARTKRVTQSLCAKFIRDLKSVFSADQPKAILLRLWKCEGDANTRIFEGFASSKVNPTTGQVTITTNCGYGHHVLNLKLLKVVKSNAFSVQVMGVDGSDTGPASYVFQFLPTDRNARTKKVTQSLCAKFIRDLKSVKID